MARRRRPDRRSASTGVSLLSFLSFLPHFSLSRSAAAQLRLGLHPATIWSHQPPPATAAAAYTAVSPPSTERDRERGSKRNEFRCCSPDSRRSSVDIAGQKLRLEDHDLKKRMASKECSFGSPRSHYSSVFFSLV
ncbi:uncharacterized protein LOC125186418 isoform X2 [Salvia hispanica]|uniref:uncharacterized protein LOC125186418 isoform X2 n=1 Tax=Salvia hispanica TaxID=49212 RepID=UPI0020097832|nr:uncharacterized protein LOC125186418 isoform X2 [Salvia hispanica]